MAVADVIVPAAGPRMLGGLATRIVTGFALAAVAIGAVRAGGIAFTALVAAACLLMSAEWSVMHGVARGFRLASLVALALVAGMAVYVAATGALIVLAASAGVIGLFMRGYDRTRAFWVAAGVLYCGLPMIALLWLRALPSAGLTLTVATFAIVWATDIAAFFTGRAVGGPKFVPSISPNKTWAGVVGGVLAAAVAGGLSGLALHTNGGTRLHDAITTVSFAVGGVCLGAFLGWVAVGGDLFESWLKRRAGVKDSGNLLPGHGGVLDRIDGLVPVAVVAAVLVDLVGITR